jgi:hypothetical protein
MALVEFPPDQFEAFRLMLYAGVLQSPQVKLDPPFVTVGVIVSPPPG